MGWRPPGGLTDVSLLAARPDLAEVVELRGEWQQAAGGVAFPARVFLVRSCTFSGAATCLTKLDRIRAS